MLMIWQFQTNIDYSNKTNKAFNWQEISWDGKVLDYGLSLNCFILYFGLLFNVIINQFFIKIFLFSIKHINLSLRKCNYKMKNKNLFKMLETNSLV